ncbi:MAG TPA: hypothetical protein VFK05_39705 [Polyangiaceae bacterium]|nr:hypothetical protein [Polyangiaceae bacterium]
MTFETPSAPTAPADAPAETPAPAPTSSASAAPPASPPVSEPPAPAKVAKKDRVRFEIGGRVGYAMPIGSLSSSTKLNDVFTGTIPGVLDLWARIPGGFAIGGYFGLAAGIQGHALDSCANCSALDFRAGLQAAKHFKDTAILDPWVGIGIGWEWASVSQIFHTQGVEFTSDSTYSAFPELSAHAGLDIGGETVAFGPYVSISYAPFNKVKSTLSCSDIRCTNENIVTGSSDVDGGGHGWFSFGVRGTYMR